MKGLRALFWGSLALKLVLTAALPLTSDEAYYWIWSNHLQLSYYDHPPFVAWLFALGQYTSWLPGSVRWPGVLLAHAGLFIWLDVFSKWLSPTQRWWWLLLALLSPLLGGSALIVTPDVPLLFFYAAATWTWLRWTNRPDIWWSLALGLVIGLGVTSKYMMVLFPLSLLVPTWRTRETRWGLVINLPWLTLGFLAGTCPVWLWNVTNDFASFKFQARHGLGRKDWKPSWTIEYVALQFAILSPVVVYLATRLRPRTPSFVKWMAWTPLVFFFCTTARGYVEANWPVAAYPPMLALAVAALPTGRRALGLTAAFWGAVFAGLAAVILVQPGATRDWKVREFNQFDAVIARVRDVRPLFARNYQMASKLSFELGRPVNKLRGMNRVDFFDYLSESAPTTPEYFLIAEPDERLPAEFTERGDQVVERTTVDGTFELWKVRVK